MTAPGFCAACRQQRNSPASKPRWPPLPYLPSASGSLLSSSRHVASIGLMWPSQCLSHIIPNHIQYARFCLASRDRLVSRVRFLSRRSARLVSFVNSSVGAVLPVSWHVLAQYFVHQRLPAEAFPALGSQRIGVEPQCLVDFAVRLRGVELASRLQSIPLPLQ